MTASKTDASSFMTSTLGIKFKPGADKSVQDVPTHIRKDYDRIYSNSGSHWIYATQENNCSRPLKLNMSTMQNCCGNDFTHSNGHHLMEVHWVMRNVLQLLTMYLKCHTITSTID